MKRDGGRPLKRKIWLVINNKKGKNEKEKLKETEINKKKRKEE